MRRVKVKNRQFYQRFRGLRPCHPNPSGESGIKRHTLDELIEFDLPLLGLGLLLF
jgi:hypothetical protein